VDLDGQQSAQSRKLDQDRETRSKSNPDGRSPTRPVRNRPQLVERPSGVFPGGDTTRAVGDPSFNRTGGSPGWSLLTAPEHVLVLGLRVSVLLEWIHDSGQLLTMSASTGAGESSVGACSSTASAARHPGCAATADERSLAVPSRSREDAVVTVSIHGAPPSARATARPRGVATLEMPSKRPVDLGTDVAHQRPGPRGIAPQATAKNGRAHERDGQNRLDVPPSPMPPIRHETYIDLLADS